MRFEVPQFIEIEDKIFGPFTWKQFIYLIGGVGFAVVLFITTPFYIFILAGIPFAGLGALLAFYPVNNRPFSTFLEAAFDYYSRTKAYRWQKSHGAVYTGMTTQVPVQLPEGKNDLNSLARKLELKALQQER